jgi:hypothetical protein
MLRCFDIGLKKRKVIIASTYPVLNNIACRTLGIVYEAIHKEAEADGKGPGRAKYNSSTIESLVGNNAFP